MGGKALEADAARQRRTRQYRRLPVPAQSAFEQTETQRNADTLEPTTWQLPPAG